MPDSLETLLLPAGPVTPSTQSAPRRPARNPKNVPPKFVAGVPTDERLTLAKFHDYLTKLAASKTDLRERASVLAYRDSVFAGPMGVLP